jgi:hypothetical protein
VAQHLPVPFKEARKVPLLFIEESFLVETDHLDPIYHDNI